MMPWSPAPCSFWSSVAFTTPALISPDCWEMSTFTVTPSALNGSVGSMYPISRMAWRAIAS